MQKPLTAKGVSCLWKKVKEYVDKKTVAGLFSLEVDTNGNLYAVYPDGTVPPKFEFDKTTGNLYFLTDD